MKTTKLEVELRTEKGKNNVKKMRLEGRIPAVVYGEGTDNIAVTVERNKIRKIYRGKLGKNTPIELTIKGQEKETQNTVISYKVDVNAISQLIEHVDFLTLQEEKAIRTVVPIELKGTAPGVKAGGIFILKIKEIKMECLPKNIPASIPIDISSLEIGQDIKIRDIAEANPDLTILVNEANAIVRIEPPRVKIEGEGEEGEEATGEEGAEGEETSAEAGDAKPAGDAPAAAEKA
jgi:large subunit ribosomal protein L25